MSPYTSTLTNTWVRVSIAISMGLLAAGICALPLVKSIEGKLYDIRIRLAAKTQPAHDDIVVVAIDDESLDRMEPFVGSWPWPRWVHTLVLDYCSEASVIAMDILLSERQWQYRETGDPYLVRAMRELGDRVVLAAHFNNMATDMPVPIGLERMRVQCDVARLQSVRLFNQVTAPFHDLLTSCRSIGDVGVRHDPDGTVRSYQALVGLGDDVYPSLAASAFAAHLDVSVTNMVWDRRGGLHIGQHSLPLQRDGSFRLMPRKTPYTTISAVDLVDSFNAESEGHEPVVDRSTFRDKIVLYGSTAFGLHDQQLTSMGTATSGILIHAHALHSCLTDAWVRVAPPWISGLLMGLLALYPAAGRYRRPWYFVLMASTFLFVYVLIACALALLCHCMIPMVGPVLALVLCAMALGSAYWGEERQRRRYVESLDTAKQTFTDMLVHDLKNTVAPITMTLSAVGKKGESAQFWEKDFPEIVATCANRLVTQINALLDIRKMQEGKLKLCTEKVPVNEMVRSVVEDYQVATERSNLGLSVDSDLLDSVCADVDRDVFVRMMANLIWNAVKYADVKSTINIRVQETNSMAKIYVTNQGRPIPQEVQQKLFQAFVTGLPPENGQTAIPSTGLGLTFCKLAAEAHGGSIRLMSPVPDMNTGVSVEVTIPLHVI